MIRRTLLFFLAITLLAPAALAADETVKAPAKKGTPEWAVIKAFEAALAGDFDKYLEAVHPEHKETRDQRGQRERYEWKRFLKQHGWYLTARDPISFVVVSRRDEGNYMRLFLKDQHNKDRMPVPVRLMKHDDKWFIMVSSL